MRAGSSLMDVFTHHHPALAHAAPTRVPPVWRHPDACLAGRTGIAGIMSTPSVRTAVAPATRLTPGSPRTP